MPQQRHSHGKTKTWQQIRDFYRSIFADVKVDREEAAELASFFASLSPRPDLVQLRATVFKVGKEFLSKDGDRDHNVSLLRTMNYVVHAMEQTCMQPKPLPENAKAIPLDTSAVGDMYRRLYEDTVVDPDENEELLRYFRSNPPETAQELIQARALAFKSAADYLKEDDKAHNVQLFRCINVIVHALEATCMQVKPPATVAADRENAAPAVPDFLRDVDLAGMSLAEAVQFLWELDINRLDPNEDYRINVQGGKKPYWKEDKAEDPLFDYVRKHVWKRPTYRTFRALLDNYVAQTGEAEVATRTERDEEYRFLYACQEQAAMQFCLAYCRAKDKSNHHQDYYASDKSFVRKLHHIWFALYNRQRGGPLDSCGFEHVFTGEVKDGKVTGFHNWIQLYLEERAGKLDYRGYIKPRGTSTTRHGDDYDNTDADDHLLTLQFRWKGVEKSVGSSFIGVSPEFELALYTICFLTGGEENRLELDTGTGDTFGVNVKCYKMGKDQIGTAFPMVTSHYDE